MPVEHYTRLLNVQ